MYTPKRNSKFHDDSNVGRADSPFRLGNTSFSQDNDFSAKRTPSRNQLSQVIEQSETHQLLTFGGALPLDIAECLSISPNNNKACISSKIHPSGWVSIIYNRKLYVWRYVASTVRKAVKCIELQLPSTELKHDGNLTCIIENKSSDPLQSFNSKTGLLFISAEGTLQYWQNINRPSMTTVSALPLNGKQCHSLLAVMPYGCVMTTTSNEIYFINPSHSGIHCRQLTYSSGMLSNIGRRVSSFWFQPVSSESKHPPCVCSATIEFDSSERVFLVAVNESIQRWELTGISEHENRMISEVDLRKCLKNFQNTLPDVYSDFDSIEVLDMKTAGYGTIMLIAIWKNEEFICILATLKWHENQLSITRVVLLDNCLEEDELSIVKLTLPLGDYYVYVSTKTKIFAQSVSNSKWNPVKVEFNKVSGGIITGGCCASESVFLTRKHGLVTLKLTQAPEIMMLDKTIEQETTAKANLTNESLPIDITDCYTGLKTAFVAYSKKQMGMQNLLSSIDCSSQEMRLAILRISCELLDSSPATDATWAAQRNIGLVTSAVLLLNQLQDKEQIHNLFIEFLNNARIWEKVGQFSASAQFYLHENNEKLQSMIALLDMYNRSSQLIDEVLNAIDVDRSETSEETYLNKKDLFFTKVTDIGRFFSSMVAIEEERLSELSTLKEQVDWIFAVSELFTTCFTAAWQYRLSVDKGLQKESRHVPWTGSSEGFNNRSLLKRQIHLQLEKAVPNVDSTKVGSSLTQQVVLLADLFLDGYECQLSSFPQQQQQRLLMEEYSQERQFILLSLVKCGYYEEATTLAEKYEDFVALIIICEKTKDNDKLEEYKIMFHQQGFSNVLYQWYMDKGAWGKLMSQDDKVDSLNSFLVQYEHLSWLQLIEKNDFSKASHVLKHLSNKEDIYASRKKIMLVLSHLALLASDEPSAETTSQLNGIDNELQLLEYEELIMKILRKDFSTMKPLSANELLELCLDYDLTHVSDDDMTTIFQLLRYDEVTKDTGLRLWCKCIEHDRWEDCPQLDYVSVVTQKRVFRCLKQCQDADISRGLIPALEDLLACHHVDWDPIIVQQIKACYEVLQL